MAAAIAIGELTPTQIAESLLARVHHYDEKVQAFYLQAQRVRRWLKDTVNSSMDEFDAILTATAPGAAPFDTSISGDGDASLLTPWSTLGNPTANIPGGLDRRGRRGSRLRPRARWGRKPPRALPLTFRPWPRPCRSSAPSSCPTTSNRSFPEGGSDARN
jgi:Asp-tRNA(Asn)/Glu-tRNA(Gln) amidotransferase A subunit family amidase